MPKFGKKSLLNLSQADEKLQILFDEVVKHYDCSVICGHRGRAEQEDAFQKGKSKLRFPKSKHNSLPSKAVDVVPYINGAISWDSRECYAFGGFVMGVASQMGLKIRWGGDWDSDGSVSDNKFNDLVHFELA